MQVLSIKISLLHAVVRFKLSYKNETIVKIRKLDDFSIKIFNFVQNQLIFHKQTRSPIIRCIYNPYHPNYVKKHSK